MLPLPLKATKWLSLEMLLSEEELRALFKELLPFTLYFNGGVVKKSEVKLSVESYLSTYRDYLKALTENFDENPLAFRSALTALLTRDKDAVALIPVEGERAIVRAVKPSIQLFEHVMHYSEKEGRFHSMVHGKETISWGIILTYPQLYEDPKTKEPVEAMKGEGHPNSELFRLAQRWSRKNTLPAPLLIEGKRINLTARVGKAYLEKAKEHPELRRRGIEVDAIS